VSLPSDRILARLMALHPKVIDLSLGRIERLLAALGNPERRLPPVVHVAGTNGKGSTIAMLRAGLEASGARVHVYTSPHLARFHERVRLAGALISEEALSRYLERCEAANGGAPITYFEITTAAAFLAFSEHPADALLLEVGLGGRLDATNVVDEPRLCAITPVALDHQHFLGETVAEIAGEKAGILKPGVPCVVGPQSGTAMDVIDRCAAAVGAPLLAHGRDWTVWEEHGRMVFQDTGGLLDLPPPKLIGAHQVGNAGTAVAALRALGVGEAACAAAVRDADWPARLQRLRTGPLVKAAGGAELWLDGGHNPAAGAALAEALGRLPARPLHLVVGMLRTKDVEGFLRPLAAVARGATGVGIAGESATLSAEETVAAALAVGLPAVAAGSPLVAVARAAEQVPTGRIVVCGSLYLAGQILRENGIRGLGARVAVRGCGQGKRRVARVNRKFAKFSQSGRHGMAWPAPDPSGSRSAFRDSQERQLGMTLTPDQPARRSDAAPAITGLAAWSTGGGESPVVRHLAGFEPRNAWRLKGTGDEPDEIVVPGILLDDFGRSASIEAVMSHALFCPVPGDGRAGGAAYGRGPHRAEAAAAAARGERLGGRGHAAGEAPRHRRGGSRSTGCISAPTAMCAPTAWPSPRSCRGRRPGAERGAARSRSISRPRRAMRGGHVRRRLRPARPCHPAPVAPDRRRGALRGLAGRGRGDPRLRRGRGSRGLRAGGARALPPRGAARRGDRRGRAGRVHGHGRRPDRGLVRASRLAGARDRAAARRRGGGAGGRAAARRQRRERTGAGVLRAGRVPRGRPVAERRRGQALPANPSGVCRRLRPGWVFFTQRPSGVLAFGPIRRGSSGAPPGPVARSPGGGRGA
jgi:dihydrofolate synthase / folylpolyglutamate synthase